MLKENYSPMYFLSSLGAGGLSISFFMYLTFLIDHKGYPMATFEHIMPVLEQGSIFSALTGLVLIAIVFFAFLHLKLLLWNVKEYKAYTQTKAFIDLKKSNAEVSLMAIPLTFTMTINTLFVVSNVFIPNLTSVMEILFPFALVAMSVAGFYALKIFGAYAFRIFIDGGFKFEGNNNFSQLIAVFAFSMVAVSFAAPGAMSHNIAINAIGMFLSLFFTSLALFLLFVKLLIAVGSIKEHGIGVEASPSIWILIPILTLLGITIVRISVGVFHNFESSIHDISLQLTQSNLFVTTSIILSIQLFVGFIGYKVLQKLDYFKDYIDGDKKSPISFALICPGVALMVFGMFFINFGLTFGGILDKYSILYFVLMAPFVFVQYKTIITFFKLNKKFF